MVPMLSKGRLKKINCVERTKELEQCISCKSSKATDQQDKDVVLQFHQLISNVALLSFTSLSTKSIKYRERETPLE